MGLEILAWCSIPIVSALVGWGTNVLALKMTFYPLEPFGWPPWFGWQGIIPSKAARMAGVSVELMTQRLLRVEEVFARIKPEAFTEELRPTLEQLTVDIIDQTIHERAPRLWALAPQRVRELVYGRARAELPRVIADSLEDVQARITDLFDLKRMAIDALVRDKALLNRIFLDCGEQEFKFIERSGLGFGFLFGIVQAVVWFLVPAWWVLPAAGFLVGYLTNLLALKMIFEPIEARKVGPFTWQGLFLKRQQEVAETYATIVAHEILDVRSIVTAIIEGPRSDELFDIIEGHLQRAIDEFAPVGEGLVKVAVGTEDYRAIKDRVRDRLLAQVPAALEQVHDLMESAMDIEGSLRERLGSLPAPEFVGILRPVFQEEELKLILVGAALGVAVGFGQLIFVFGGI